MSFNEIMTAANTHAGEARMSIIKKRADLVESRKLYISAKSRMRGIGANTFGDFLEGVIKQFDEQIKKLDSEMLEVNRIVMDFATEMAELEGEEWTRKKSNTP